MSDDVPVLAATRTLALLRAQADAVRADLAGLRREFGQAKEELSSLRTAQLMEVNDQLVQAAVHADTAAQTAVSSLDDLTRSTQHDELTGAPNRTLMLDRLEQAISMAQRRATRVGVMFVDLDRFKQINDTLGHAVGDEVLRLAARCLAGAVRDSDSISRYGGDEFVVLLAELSNAADAAPIARKMLEALAGPSVIGPHTMSLSASVGISVYPEDGADAVTLIQRADAAMYRSKKRGAGNYTFCASQASADEGDAAPMFALPANVARRPDSAFAEHEARLRELLEANRQLVSAAQIAQKLQANAEEAHRRQINFVAMAAHALRNPLLATRMAVASLRRRHLDVAVQSNLYEVVLRQNDHMVRLINDLLDGSRVGAGEFRLRRSDVRLDRAVALAVDACRHAIDAKQQHLRVTVPAERIIVLGDLQRLVQAFGNLLNDASRRSPHGGEISVTVAAGGNEAMATVASDGVGIAPEVLPHIFDLFTVDTNLPLDESGLGIGLPVAHELIKSHGGRIAASSHGKDLGSEFVVRLPCRRA